MYLFIYWKFNCEKSHLTFNSYSFTPKFKNLPSGKTQQNTVLKVKKAINE
jgi:hypothetical protein